MDTLKKLVLNMNDSQRMYKYLRVTEYVPGNAIIMEGFNNARSTPALGPWSTHFLSLTQLFLQFPL